MDKSIQIYTFLDMNQIHKYTWWRKHGLTYTESGILIATAMQSKKPLNIPFSFYTATGAWSTKLSHIKVNNVLLLQQRDDVDV